MKLGFKRGTEWYSAVNRTLLNSQWSHSAVAIECPDGWRLFESAALKGSHGKAGVRDYLLTPEVADDYVWIDLGNADDQSALERYNQVRGYGYDYASLLSFLPVWNVRDSKRLYCHELTLHMIGGYVKWRVTPEIILYQLTIRK